MATMESVAAMLEATARMQREIAAVLHDLAARTGNEATIQHLRRAKDPAHRLVPVPTGRSAPHARRDPRPPGRVRPRSLPDPLTPREEAVLYLLTSRLSLREISQELYVSLNTVKSHTRAIYRKLNASTRDEAVQRGRDLTILPGLPQPGAHLPPPDPRAGAGAPEWVSGPRRPVPGAARRSG